ncbi:erythromycin esterase family protein [Brachybacterium hainanense]|uniref:Erythromycin esterase family protein n=1 Tax=Brachybacterium hainanense TaxID=1541174 RepID=A0ABV6R8I5_9MICO
MIDGSGFTDDATELARLDALGLVPDHGVLALGEPTHGTGEAFAWKMEVILALARRGRLAALAFEDPYATGLLVDDALRGDGDLDAAWGRASSVWRTGTIRDGLMRLRDLNRRLPVRRRIRFLGIDIRRPSAAAQRLLDAGCTSTALDRFARGAEPSPEDLAALGTLLPAMAEDAAAVEVRGAARQLARHIDAYLLEPDLEGLHRRDAHMARTLLENLPREGLTVLWAHNEHIARDPDNFGGPSTGHVLAEELGGAYVPVGALCGEGTCRAVDPSTGDPGWRSVPLPPVRPGTTEDALRTRGEAIVLTSDLAHPGPRRFIGWSLDTSLFESAPDTFEVRRPSSDFEAIRWFATSTADTDTGRVGWPGVPAGTPGALIPAAAPGARSTRRLR